MKRRDFIQQSVAGVMLPALLNGLPFRAFGNISETALGDENILVVVQLTGGNDGLNTVIPIDKYSLYQNARQNIAIPSSKLLKIPQSDKVGLNPALSGLSTLFQEGKASLIQSVGYPNPSFSHFRATDIWNSSSDSNQNIYTGWAGRYLAINHPNYPESYPNSKYPDPLALQIGSVVSTALQGPLASMGMAITDPTSFYNLLTNKVETTPNTLAGKELKYLREVASQSNQYATAIKTAVAKVTKQVDYPTSNSLADQLKIVAKLIGGGLKTKIYFVSLGGFDTHSNQTNATDTTIGTHANLLKQVGDAMKAFMDDLKALGVSKKVAGFTFSEFGRRIKSNASGGTDHGSAAPMFLFGEMLNSAVIGNTPDIPSSPTTSDNVPMQYDFRSIYASFLENWFCMDSNYLDDVLLKNFQSLNLIQVQVCGKITQNEPQEKEVLLTNFPNPFEDFTTLSFDSKGGYTLIQIIDNMGREILRPFEDEIQAGNYQVILDTKGWRSGIYYARLQNKELQQVRKILKI